jgi:uncharacterized damage-inducible protein DinB
MNDDIASLYEFNKWADAKVYEAVRKLTPEQYIAEPVTGWAPIRSTLNHIAIVTEGWMRGIAGESVESFPSEADLPTIDDAERHLLLAYKHLETVIPILTPEWLNTPRKFGSRHRVAILPPWVVLRHIVNHATYHRGQVASKLKRFGIEPPSIDMVFWAMAKIPQNS